MMSDDASTTTQFKKQLSKSVRTAVRLMCLPGDLHDNVKTALKLLERCERNLLRSNVLMSTTEELQEHIRQLIAIAQRKLSATNSTASTAYKANLVRDGSPGRPRYSIGEDQLKFLFDASFTVPQMAEIFGCKSRTIQSRLKWNIVIHGCIDGYSRLFPVLYAANNNRAATVLTNFVSATKEYGVPSRIRVDKGHENRDVCSYMNDVRGSGRGSAIPGKSVHNTRIERGWVDVWLGATNVFHRMFTEMERDPSILLNVGDQIQMWCLHYVFIPRLNKELTNFRLQWNEHGVSTEASKTPRQLYIGGMLANRNSQLTAIQNPFPTPSQTNASDDNPSGIPEEIERQISQRRSLQVPTVACPLDASSLALLEQTVDPLRLSSNKGLDVYADALSFVRQHLAQRT